MTKSNIKVDGLDFSIVPSGFVFVSQTCVKFYGKRISKHQLIKCCEHFIAQLRIFYSPECLKIGFNLKFFKYYELSVYLHGLISLYCSKLDCSCPPCFGLSCFSQLPHEILKPVKETLEIECALLHTRLGKPIYICIPYVPFAADTFEQLKSIVSNTYLARKYHLVFTLK